MILKELRLSKGLSQSACAKYLGIPLRTYQNYENDVSKATSIKYDYMMSKLSKYGFIDESHGLLTIEGITQMCVEVFKSYNVEYCYLFGSYAKGKATEISDVDLLIATTITGMQFFELTERLRESLKKKVDLLNLEQMKGNIELVNEILKDGLKIYG